MTPPPPPHMYLTINFVLKKANRIQYLWYMIFLIYIWEDGKSMNNSPVLIRKKDHLFESAHIFNYVAYK
jgi:hypothetical protein